MLEIGKPTRIIYVSDFDPAGQCMPVSVGRKIEYFIRHNQLDIDVKLQPAVLTLDQIAEFRLPRTPIKESERRRDRFEAENGTGAVELDALEALHPGELRRILLAEVERWYDRDLSRYVRTERGNLEDVLSQTRSDILVDYRDTIDDLKDRYADLKERYSTEVGEINGEIEKTWDEIKQKLEEQSEDIEDYPIPEGKEGDDPPDSLYESGRSYVHQLLSFKEFQGSEKHGKALDALRGGG
jgi:hypothetical protein